MSEPLHDPVLGPLRWDDHLDWWIGKVEVTPGRPIEIFISPENLPRDTVLDHARADLSRIRDREGEYRRWTARQVVGDSWNTEGEDLSLEAIVDLLRLASISFHPEGEADLYWDDQDRIYAGHNLVTDLGSDGNCIRVRMEG